MVIALSLLICVVGLVMFYICTNAKSSEVGKIMFGVGLLVFLLGGAQQLLTLLGSHGR
jgi:Na+/phosphate symporter